MVDSDKRIYGDADLNTGLEITVTVQATIDGLNNLWVPLPISGSHG